MKQVLFVVLDAQTINGSVQEWAIGLGFVARAEAQSMVEYSRGPHHQTFYSTVVGSLQVAALVLTMGNAPRGGGYVILLYDSLCTSHVLLCACVSPAESGLT